MNKIIFWTLLVSFLGFIKAAGEAVIAAMPINTSINLINNLHINTSYYI